MFVWSEIIDDKFVTVKVELEEIIEEVKNDTDEKAFEINNKKSVREYLKLTMKRTRTLCQSLILNLSINI